MLLHPGKVRISVAVGVVVDLDQLAAQGVFGVGDALRVARIHHDAQGVLIGLVRQCGIVGSQKGQIIGRIALGKIDHFSRERQPQDTLQPFACAQTVAVWTAMSEQNNMIICLDFIQNRC